MFVKFLSVELILTTHFIMVHSIDNFTFSRTILFYKQLWSTSKNCENIWLKKTRSTVVFHNYCQKYKIKTQILFETFWDETMKRVWVAVTKFNLISFLIDMLKYVRWGGNVYWGLNVSYFPII